METAIDTKELTRQQLAAWSAGDFARVASLNVLAAELLCEAVDVHPGERVLDVAAGSGNTAIAAARRHAEVTATDFVPSLLDAAARRAHSEGLAIGTAVADAQDLPFEDASFDVVLSSFGVIFAPDQERAARELLRVCRPGGRIGLANWVPEGMLADQMRLRTGRRPPPPGLRSPLAWGTEEGVRHLLGAGVASLQTTVQEVVFRFPSPEHMVAFNRTYFGPTKVAFDALDERGQTELTEELLGVLRKYNRARDGTLVAPATYLEVIAVRSA
jgi:ubiquinone/menaquinone biosynthesis C-methylase UbiE